MGDIYPDRTERHENVRAYIQLLQALHELEAFGTLAIYPSIGVDCFVARHCRLIGLNLWSYDIDGIIRELSDVVPEEMLAELRRNMVQNLTYVSGVDATRLDILGRELRRYEHVSPKSLVLKGLFDSAFLREWDSDSERYYPLSQDRAYVRSSKWVETILSCFKPGDRVVVFDPPMVSAVRAQSRLTEVETRLPQLEPDPLIVQRRQAPIIYLPRGVALFEYS